MSSLAEPQRRALYRFVVERGDAVSKDEAAEAMGVARTVAGFHLDRLVADGLLTTEFRRLTGRQGPGAGRPAKLYRRAPGEISVSLPPRQYDLAAALLASAVNRSIEEGKPVDEALADAATARGRELVLILDDAQLFDELKCRRECAPGYGRLPGLEGCDRDAIGLEAHGTDDDVMRVLVPAGRTARDVFALASNEGVQVRHLRPSVPTLEDVFVDAIEGGGRAHP